MNVIIFGTNTPQNDRLEQLSFETFLTFKFGYDKIIAENEVLVRQDYKNGSCTRHAHFNSTGAPVGLKWALVGNN